MRILLLAPYPLGKVASQRFRFEQYLDPLAERGIDIHVHPLLDEPTARVLYQRGHVPAKSLAVVRGAVKRLTDLISAQRYQAVFIHREAFPLGYPIVERLLSVLRIPYIFDFDDAIYLANTSDANRWVAPLKYPAKTQTTVRHASLVLAGNRHLAGWAQSFNDEVRILPTTIDTELYLPRERQRRERVCVGWSGSLTTIEHLRPLGGVLANLQRSHGIRIKVIGDPSFSLPGAKVEALAWQESSELTELADIDIGIMPLPDDDWARGKCGFKALQYMGLGIPAVISPVGVNVEIARDGAARLASGEQQWREVLTELIEDPECRLAQGRRGRRRVEDEYSVRAHVEGYVDAIRTVVGFERA